MSTSKKAVKKPQDHKPKADEAPTKVVVNTHDRDWVIQAEVFNDFELMGMLAEMDEGNLIRAAQVVKIILGPEQYMEAMDLLRDEETGRVSLEAGAQFAHDLMTTAEANVSE